MKRRYFTLDALRGVAAVAVFFHHADGVSAPLGMPAGYRAVDLFFILSGFVLSHAYEQRLRDHLMLGRFMAARVTRLYPLYLLGLLIGAGGAFIAAVLAGGDLTMNQIAISSMTMALMLPSPATGVLMPLNVPAWSLFFEMAINLVYGAVASRLSNTRLISIVVLSALTLSLLSINAGTTNLGNDWRTFAGGAARVTFSFFGGVALFRLPPPPVLITRWGWVLPVLSLPMLFYGHEVLAADLACVLMGFPALIWLGAKLEVPDKMLASVMGDTSFGLYVIHVPVIMLTYKPFSYLGSDANKFAPWTGVVLVSVLLPAIYVLDRFYDRPARRLVASFLHGAKNQVEPRSG